MAKICIGDDPIRGTLIRCCSCNKYYDFKGNIFSSTKKKEILILICPYCGLKHKIDFKLFKKKITNLIRIKKLDLAAIDMGCEAIDRAANEAPTITMITKTNPANATGIITSIEVWCDGIIEDFEVAIFYKTNGNVFTTRDNHYIGHVDAGSKQTFPVNLNVVEGDYIGFYGSEGTIEMDSTGGLGYWFKPGDNIPCTGVTFTLSGNTTYMHSVYGIGTTIEIKNAAGKSSIPTSVISVLSRGKIETVSGKVDVTSIISSILYRIKKANAKSPIITSIDSLLSRGKVESVSGKADITSSIISILSRGKIETVSGKASVNTTIVSVLNRGKIEDANGKSSIDTDILITLSRGIISDVSGKSSLITNIDSVLSRGKVEDVNGKSDITSNVSVLLSRGIIENTSGKSSIDSIIDIVLSKGKIENVNGKVDIISNIITILNRGIIENTSGIISITTLIDSLVEVVRIEDASGKSQLDTNIDTILKRIASINGKAYIYTSIDTHLAATKKAIGKADIDSLINISLTRILKGNGKSIFDTLIEAEVTQQFAFTQITLDIVHTTAEAEIKE